MAAHLLMQILWVNLHSTATEKKSRQVRFNFVGGAKAYSPFLTNKQTGYARPTDQRTAVSDIPTLGHPVVAVKPEVCPTSGLHFLCEALDVPHPLPCAGCTVWSTLAERDRTSWRVLELLLERCGSVGRVFDAIGLHPEKALMYCEHHGRPRTPPLSHHKVITSDDRGGSPPSKGDDWVMPDPGQVMTGVGHVRLQVMTG